MIVFTSIPKGVKYTEAEVITLLSEHIPSIKDLDVSIMNLKTWSDKSGKFVHRKEFFDSLKADEPIVFFNAGPLKFLKWSIEQAIASGNAVGVYDTDGWFEKFPCFTGEHPANYLNGRLYRSGEETTRLFWSRMGDHLRYEDALYKDSHPWAENLLGIPQDYERHPGIDLPSWMRSSYLNLISEVEVKREYSWIDSRTNERLYGSNKIKTVHKYVEIIDGEQDLYASEDILQMKAEFERLVSLCGTPDDYDHFGGSYAEWQLLGKLEQYFGHASGDEDSHYWENPNKDDYEESQSAYL